MNNYFVWAIFGKTNNPNEKTEILNTFWTKREAVEDLRCRTASLTNIQFTIRRILVCS